MDLKSENPFWLIKNGLLATYPPLDRDLSCEVAVIGGGITGALVANRLIEAGLETIVLDRRDIGQGSTSTTTGLVQYEIDTHLCDLAERIGEKPAARAYHLCLDSITRLESVVNELSDRCDFLRKRSLYLASRPGDVPQLAEECQCRKKIGLNVTLLTADELAERFQIHAPAALLSADAAQLDAFRLTHRLFERNLRRGLKVFDRTEITGVERLQEGVRLTTNREAIVSARKVVFATGYESQQDFKLPTVQLKSTYAFVTQPLPELVGWPNQYLLWESSRPYVYLRMTDEKRILMGGEDEDFHDPVRRDALIPQKTKRLLKRLHELLPGTAVEAEYAWAGTFAETEDGLAYIGPTDQFPHAYFALGFGGNGISFGVIAAEMIRDWCLGRTNPDAALFRFDR